MKFTITRRGALVGAGSLAAVTALPTGILADAHSAHEILMLNKDPDNPENKMLFAPNILRALKQTGMKIEHVTRICFAAWWATQKQRHLAIRHGLF